MTEHLDALTLNGWADGLLAPDERQRAVAHLAHCAECRARSAGQAQTAQLLRQLAPEAPPPQLARNIVAVVAAASAAASATAKAERGRSEAAWARLAGGSALAALLGLLLVAVAWPDLARLLPAMAGAAPLTSVGNVLDVPADALATLASSAFGWGSALTEGAGAALLTGLVLLTGAAFGGLAQLLRPGVASS
jgi:predicted anti-sigma-YlaC factor YlaD